MAAACLDALAPALEQGFINNVPVRVQNNLLYATEAAGNILSHVQAAKPAQPSNAPGYAA
jgi:hypothetical protein